MRSNLTARSIGRSAGGVPFRTRPTRFAKHRHLVDRSKIFDSDTRPRKYRRTIFAIMCAIPAHFVNAPHKWPLVRYSPAYALTRMKRTAKAKLSLGRGLRRAGFGPILGG